MKASYPRRRRRKRKCACCRELYMPDARHFHDQNYCTKPACRHASKVASHRRWYASDKAAEHRDPAENKRRVREWRAAHPDYAKLTGGRGHPALQETKDSQDTDREEFTAILTAHALQDMNLLQPALVVGLMSQLTGSALQDTIAETSRRLLLLGHDILGTRPGITPEGGTGNGDRKASSVS